MSLGCRQRIIAFSFRQEDCFFRPGQPVPSQAEDDDGDNGRPEERRSRRGSVRDDIDQHNPPVEFDRGKQFIRREIAGLL